MILDISEGGAGVLYPGFVHQESVCVVHLRNLDDELISISGKSVWCRFVSRSVHAVGVQWDAPADVRQFVSNRRWLEQVASNDEIKRARLGGTLLLVGFDVMEVDLIAAHLEDEDLTIETTDDTGAAHDRLATAGVDAIMVDGDHPGVDTKQFYADARASGIHEPITVVTSKTDGYEVWAADTGAAVFGRPFSAEMLSGLLREQILMSSNPLSGSQPIYSSLPADKSAAVATYIERLLQCADQLESTINADNAAFAVRIAQTIQNTADGYGFPILEQAAGKAIVAVNASMSAAEAGVELRQLVRFIGRLRSGERSTA